MKSTKIMTIVILIIFLLVASFSTFFLFSNDMGELRQLVSRYFRKEQKLPQNMNTLIDLLKRNTIAFKISQKKPTLTHGQSKFGGMPDVPKDFEWPNTKNGQPLSFLTQINCTEIKSMDAQGLLPTSGILYFFYELSDMDTKAVGNDSFIRVLYCNPDSQNILASRPFPSNLAKENRLPEYALDFEVSTNIPSWNDLYALFPDQELDELASTDEYDKLLEKQKSPKINGRLLGYADLIQNSMLEENPDPDNAVLLFQLNSCDTPDGFSLMFGDYGNLYFYIQRDDLLRLDFSKIHFESQCY